MIMESNKRKPVKHILLPICLLIYLAVIAYIGRSAFYNPEERTMYLVKIVIGVVAIILLYFVLKKKIRLKQERENDINSK